VKRIGFIDYYLDEWHANNYPLWIEDASHGGQFKVAYAWAAMDKPGGLTTDQWCARFGVMRASSQDELITGCDCIVVLSPDNAEQHETLAALALISGKPVYIDKTFATNHAAAERMFNLARKNNTPMYSTSALRYACEFASIKTLLQTDDLMAVATRGPGKFSNYAIHQLEMIVKAMGPGVRSAVAVGSPQIPCIFYDFGHGRSALLHCIGDCFSLALTMSSGEGRSMTVSQNFWSPFIDDLLHFFESGESPVPAAETLTAIAMYEAGLKALEKPGMVILCPDNQGRIER
jgi:hypothetical protein